MMMLNKLLKVSQGTPGVGIYRFGMEKTVHGDMLEPTEFTRPRTTNVKMLPKMSGQIARAVLDNENVSFARTTHGFYCECDDLDGSNSSERFPVLLDPADKKIYHTGCPEFDANKHSPCHHIVAAFMGYCMMEDVGHIKDHTFWQNFEQNKQDVLDSVRVIDFERLTHEIYETIRIDIGSPAGQHKGGIAMWSGADYPAQTPRFLEDKTPSIFGRSGVFTLRNRMIMPSATSAPIGNASPTPSQAPQGAPAGAGFIEDAEDDDPVLQTIQMNMPTKRDNDYPDNFRKLIPSKRLEMYLDPMGGKRKEEIVHYIRDCQELGLTPALLFTGPPSVGKTFLADCIAGSYNAPRIKVSCNADMRPEHVLGNKTKKKDGSIGFSYAPALKAAMYGFVTVFDEIQTLSDEMTPVLHSFSDESRVIEVKGADDEDEVQYVDVHPDTIIVGTANEGWAYKTFHAADPAHRSRFFVLGITYPDQDTMTDLLLKAVNLDKSHKSLAKRIAGCGEKLREMFDNQELQYICDFRTMRQWLQMCKLRNPLEAGAATLVDKLAITEAERKDVRNVLEQYF